MRQTIKNIPLPGLILLFFASCATTQEKKESATTALQPLSLFFSSNRFAELEPCGCSANQLGGVDREWNVVNKWRESLHHPTLYLVSGTTFVPAKGELKLKLQKHFERKSQFVVNALNDLGVNFLSPSIDDMQLGEAAIKKLEASATFSFLSTNLYSKRTGMPVFRHYMEFNHQGLAILLLGLSHSSQHDPADFMAKPAAAVLRQLFSELPVRNRFVILLSSLGKTENEELKKQFPQVKLVLGALEEDTTMGVEQFAGDYLFVNPSDRGRVITHLFFDMKNPAEIFYNPIVAKNVPGNKKLWQERLAEIAEELKNAPPEARSRLEEQRARFAENLKRAESIPLQPTDQAIEYRSNTVNLDARLENPPNKLTELLGKYKATVRKLAVEPGH